MQEERKLLDSVSALIAGTSGEGHLLLSMVFHFQIINHTYIITFPYYQVRCKDHLMCQSAYGIPFIVGILNWILLILSHTLVYQQIMSEKTFFGSIDFRNAKYQGSIRNGFPEGLALLFDLQHLFAISNFKKDTLNGPTLIVFPTRDYLYGNIKNSALEGICVFAKATGQSYVFNFTSGQSKKIAYSDHNHIVIQLFSREGKLKLGETTSFKDNHSNKWNIISQILATEIPEHMRNFKSYLQFTLEREHADVVDCSQASGLTFIGFKDTPSLGVKFNRENKVAQVGYFEAFPRNIQFGRKYLDSASKKDKVQEGKFTQSERIFTYSQKRPIQAIRYTEEYFKRGTNFKNSFFKITFFQDIARFLDKTQRQVNSIEFIQFGQKILEGTDEKQLDLPDDIVKTKEYTIQQVKKQIYAALSKRHTGARRESTALELSRQKLRASRERNQNYTPGKHNYTQRHQNEAEDRSVNKKQRYIYSQKVYNQHPYAQMSQKRYLRPQYSPKHNYYPYSQKKLLSQFRNIPPSPLISHYQPHYQDLYQKQLIRQEALRQIARRNISPVRQNQTSTRIHSPYEIFREIRAPEREEKVRPVQTQHFTLGKNVDSDQRQNQNNYLKYKNRNKTPGKDSHSPLKYQAQRKLEVQLSKGIMADRRMLGNAFLQHKVERQRVQDLGKREQFLPVRHKKHFKYDY